jgi:aminoglycoside/choline kinase family phosphotransferase
LNSRLQSLRDWVTATLKLKLDDLRPASADASFRRYFRVLSGDRSYIVMDAPPGKEDVSPFIEVARRFYALGLNVPEILEVDTKQGFLLLSDLGSTIYLSKLDTGSVERLYGDAMGALVVLQAGIYTDSSFLPPYDETLLQREMELFREWYVGRHLGYTLREEQNAALDAVFATLAASALAQPRVWVHRDYHSRNLMVTPVRNPGILDFQDAVVGPVTYDLVSLLRDCYISWPRTQVESWVRGYFTLASQSGLPAGESEEQFLQWFDLMGVQRHLKATGIFARLNHRDAKPGYLGDIPRTLGYVYEVCGRYRDLAPLADLLDALAVPLERAT